MRLGRLNRSNRLGAAVQISALNVCGERNLTLAAFPVVCPLSSEPDLHWRSVRRAMTSRRRCRSSYRSRWRRTGPIDPLLPATVFWWSDRSTLRAAFARRRPAATKSRNLPFGKARRRSAPQAGRATAPDRRELALPSPSGNPPCQIRYAKLSLGRHRSGT